MANLDMDSLVSKEKYLYPNALSCLPFYAKCKEFQIPVCFHTGFTVRIG